MAKEKILRVDDERATRRTLAEALQGWDYQVFEADTLASALTTFEAQSPALVLQDITPPMGLGWMFSVN